MAAIGQNRAVRGRRSPRQDAIMEIGRKARQRNQNGPGGMLGARGLGGPARSPIQPQGRFARSATRPGVGGNGEAKGSGIEIGNQLQRRVKAGAITGQQAQRTAQQRQTLEAAFGGDWRNKLGGSFNDVRQALAKNPGSQQLQQRNQVLLQKRQQLLRAARERLAGQGGNASRRRRRKGPVNPAGQGFLNPAGRGY